MYFISADPVAWSWRLGESGRYAPTWWASAPVAGSVLLRRGGARPVRGGGRKGRGWCGARCSGWVLPRLARKAAHCGRAWASPLRQSSGTHARHQSRARSWGGRACFSIITPPKDDGTAGRSTRI